MNITIIGAGNVGTQFAVHCAEKGHAVIIYGSKPDKINRRLTIVDENDVVTHQGEIKQSTSNENVAFNQAEIIFVIMPAPLMRENARKIEPFVKPGLKICLVPGTGGGECAFKSCIEKGAVVFGMQRVPSVARLVEYGKTVKAVGYRDELFVSAIPNRFTMECCSIIQNIFDIKTTALPNYLNITLIPSNPILHTTRLRTLFKDWHEGVVYDSVHLFYEEWSDESSELLIACDDEVQEICRKLRQFDLSYVKSLQIHYEGNTPSEITRTIRGIKGFKGLTSPVIKLDLGYVPDFSSRYFSADFSFGLVILMQIANFVGVDAPNINDTWNWYYRLVGTSDIFRFKDYGIINFGDFLEFYSN